ncbi:rhodanese-like domain-containing protein [Thermoflavifilum thermophilum]|uniref:Rhodanese-like domain-containing protein n=1 Tax=Thermoflavifilum thermophilum TaxID=1393122 RepID=A0A1I7NH12_9BACT|nr:rhodanese-like domain-containing protein [Thermoflavifilum thermophilum]SFV33914.1 Rhodanese-like domain-containing protein [Thermoflavifilum thermophilum]
METFTIIDVRTPQEFAGGHVEGSINIPLHEIPQRIDEIRSLQTPIIVCCASGNRSARAKLILENFGIPCENGGSWMDLL